MKTGSRLGFSLLRPRMEKGGRRSVGFTVTGIVRNLHPVPSAQALRRHAAATTDDRQADSHAIELFVHHIISAMVRQFCADDTPDGLCYDVFL